MTDKRSSFAVVPDQTSSNGYMVCKDGKPVARAISSPELAAQVMEKVARGESIEMDAIDLRDDGDD